MFPQLNSTGYFLLRQGVHARSITLTVGKEMWVNATLYFEIFEVKWGQTFVFGLLLICMKCWNSHNIRKRSKSMVASTHIFFTSILPIDLAMDTLDNFLYRTVPYLAGPWGAQKRQYFLVLVKKNGPSSRCTCRTKVLEPTRLLGYFVF